MSSSYIDLEKNYKSNWHTPFLHSHTYQQLFKVLNQNWKSYYASIKDYKKNPGKYLGVPRKPKFKNMISRKNEIIFTKYAIRFDTNILKLSLSPLMQSKYNVKSLNLDIPLRVQEHINLDKIQQIKLINVKSRWSVLIIYKSDIKPLNTSFNNIMSIDLGLNNIASVTFKDNDAQILINGRVAKSKNSYFNKEIAKYNSLNMRNIKNSAKHKNTKKINYLYDKRNNFLKDYIHKVSFRIIKLALDNKCSDIVIGDLKGIKQKCNIKSFTQIPLSLLVEQIKYKAKMYSIKVVTINESYTSLCSSLDLEPITKHSKYLGKRVKRGLFKSQSGLLINADINGSLNILRKYTKDKCTPRLIQSARVNGYVSNPLKLEIL